MTLYKQHAKTEWVSLLAWSLVLGSFIFLTVILWQQMKEMGTLADIAVLMKGMPSGLTAIYGSGDVTTLQGWLSLYAFGTLLTLPLLVYVSLFVTGIITREMDRRTIEFLLAQPVARHEIIVSRWINLLVSLLLVHLAIALGAAAGVASVGEEVELGRYLVAALNSALVLLAVGSLQLVISLFVDDYGKGLAIALGLGFGLLLLYTSTAGATGALQDLRSFIPFSLYDSVPILLEGAVPWGNMAILAGVATACFGLSIWLFQRKQISV